MIQLVACVFSGAIRDNGDCKRIFKENFSIEASDQDCEIIRRVCEAVSTRAARLAASGVVALVKKINKISGCSVAVDGSLYKLHPKFPERYCIMHLIPINVPLKINHQPWLAHNQNKVMVQVVHHLERHWITDSGPGIAS